VKKLHHLVEAARILDDKGVSFTLDIVGSPATPNDFAYHKILKESAQDLIGRGRVKFQPQVPNDDTPKIYNEHELFINLSPPGLFDKTILESMSCEVPTLVTNPSFKGSIPEALVLDVEDPNELAGRIQSLLELSTADKESIGRRLRHYVSENHGIDLLIAKIGQMTSGIK
jgi:glycosyltransferase involved in cell wall biosynthesis